MLTSKDCLRQFATDGTLGNGYSFGGLIYKPNASADEKQSSFFALSRRKVYLVYMDDPTTLNRTTPSNSITLSPNETLVNGYFPFAEPLAKFSVKGTPTVTISPARKYILFATFCLVQFLDAISSSILFSAMPALIIDLGITEGQSTWIMSAFQLTFASFLLVVSTIIAECL